MKRTMAFAVAIAVLSVSFGGSLYAQCSMSLSTGLAADNGADGITFEITALNPVTLCQISIGFNSTASTLDLEIWAHPNGFPWAKAASPATFQDGQWVLIGSATGVTIAATGYSPIPVNLSPIGLLSAGQKVGIAVFTTSTTTLRYRTGVTPYIFSDGNLSFDTQCWGLSGTTFATATAPNFPRQFCGSVSYTPGVIDSTNVPHITVSPRNFHLDNTDPTVQTLTICNTGIRDTLQYTIDSVAGRVRADTATGRLASGACKNVTLTFNRSGLPLGNTIVQLRVRHNAWLDTNPVSVPCTLFVDSAALPHIAVTPGSLKVGPTDTTVKTLTICNTGANDTLHYRILGSAATPNVLAWTYGAEMTYRYPNTVAAIRQYIPSANITTTTTTVAATLSALLQSADVFLIPEQYTTAPSSTIGTAFAPVLDSFVRRGGTVIVLGPYYETTFLTYAGLDTLTYYSYTYSTTATVNVPSDPVFDSVGLASITMPYYTSYWTGVSSAVRLASYSTYAVCTKRQKGNGTIYLLGADFYNANATWARMLDNCITKNLSSRRVTADTAVGTVAAGGCKNIQLTFNRTGLLPGPNVFQLLISHDSPLSPNPLSVPCTVFVDSASVPHIIVSPRSFHLGPTDPTVQTLAICDTSTRDTLQYTIDSVAGRVRADTATGRLAAGACRNVTLTFNRSGLPIGNTIVQLRVRHNGPLDPNPLSVPCTLYVDSASVPHISLTPGSFRITGPAATRDTMLAICNTGTYDTLHYAAAKNILAWTYGAELTTRYPNTVAAIRQYLPSANITTTTTTVAATLSALLQSADVFLIPEQYTTAPSSAIGTAFAPVLDSFVRRGGTVIVLGPYYETTFLTYAGLDTLTYSNYTYSTTATVNVPTDPVFDSVGLASITMPYYTSYWTGGSSAVRLASYSTYAVCTKRLKGNGTIYLLGADFYNANATWARMLDNCITRNVASGRVRPDTAVGTVAAGACRNVRLTFDLSSLLPGTYVFPLRVSHDSPLSPNPLSVQCTLVVDSTTMAYQVPSMAVTIFTGDTAVRNVTLQNTGSSLLLDSVIKIIHGAPVSGAILINEVSNEPDYLELVNTGSVDVNIGGWHLVWTDNIATSGSYTMPAGTVIRAHRCVVFAEAGVGTPSDSVINMGVIIGWIQSTELSVSLLNSSGTGVDFFKTSGDAATSPAGTSWTGPGFVTSGVANYYGRLTANDNNTAADWGQGAAASSSTTYCRPNPGQTFSTGVANGYITAVQDSFRINAGQSSMIRFRYDASSMMTGGFYIDTFRIIQNSKNVASPITVICTLTVISNIPVLIPVTPDPTINRRPVLSWHPVFSASTYTLEVSQTSSFSILQLTQLTSDTSFTPLADLPLSTLYWRVRCNLTTRNSLTDNFYIQNDSIPLLIPIVPDTLGPQTSTLFTWHPATGGSSYRISIYNIDSTAPQPILMTYVNDTSYRYNLGLPTGRYMWTVSASFDYARTAYPDTFWAYISSAVMPGGKAARLPQAYALEAYAAKGQLRIACAIPRQSRGRLSSVTIDLFDIRGRQLRVLFSGTLAAGYHQIAVSGESLASGIYYCRMRTGGAPTIAAVYVAR